MNSGPLLEDPSTNQENISPNIIIEQQSEAIQETDYWTPQDTMNNNFSDDLISFTPYSQIVNEANHSTQDNIAHIPPFDTPDVTCRGQRESIDNITNQKFPNTHIHLFDLFSAKRQPRKEPPRTELEALEQKAARLGKKRAGDQIRDGRLNESKQVVKVSKKYGPAASVFLDTYSEILETAKNELDPATIVTRRAMGRARSWCYSQRKRDLPLMKEEHETIYQKGKKDFPGFAQLYYESYLKGVSRYSSINTTAVTFVGQEEAPLSYAEHISEGFTEFSSNNPVEGAFQSTSTSREQISDIEREMDYFWELESTEALDVGSCEYRKNKP